jgi:asparagine synthase (glutamine-hydrolysing)
MCGFAGFFQPTPIVSAAEMEAVATRMAERIVHRGPDDAGAWADPAAGIALGFRRLSIVDLSPAGHQPMHSASGRYVIAFNGEIYNHRALRAEVPPPPQGYRGHSDTEVLLAAVEQWGVANAVRRFVGMYAFALWDRQERRLHLCRDRLGERPLYYGLMGGTLLFGSELKALEAHPAWRGEIDRDVLPLLLRYDYIPTPFSIYRGIRKLTPGTLLTLDAPDSAAAPVSYWSAREVMEKGAREVFAGGLDAAHERLDALLRATIRDQMVADVPVGALLSGGIDSSMVVALMQRESSRPVKTFTIGFHEQSGEVNEAPFAKDVAKHLGTEHTELYLTPQDALDVIPRLPTLYDEPFADVSGIPTFLVSQMARREVTVCLSGDGGDELFAGYHRHFYARGIWNRVGWLPPVARRGMAAMMSASAPLLPMGRKLEKLAAVIDTPDAYGLYPRFMSHWRDPGAVVPGASEPRTPMLDEQRAKLPDYLSEMQCLDMTGYLPDCILVKTDRAAMGVSLELRVPFLDHRVLEFAATLPTRLKLHNGHGKHVLRTLLHKYVPRELVERPKWGFVVPLGTWLRGPLRDWAESLLDESRLRREGWFDPAPIHAQWREHLAGRRDRVPSLWSVLMFQAWLDRSR